MWRTAPECQLLGNYPKLTEPELGGLLTGPQWVEAHLAQGSWLHSRV